MLSRRVAFPTLVLFGTLIAVLAPGEQRPSLAADPPAAQAPPKTNRPARRARPPRLPSSLVGRITDEKGAPVADAQLQIFPKDGGRGYFAKSKADGSSEAGLVSFLTEPGPYRLTVSYPGFAPVTKQVEVRAVQGTQNGRWETDHQLNVTLVRSTEQTKAETR
jgi:hypothetical protein